jgi:hypothetical protein
VLVISLSCLVWTMVTPTAAAAPNAPGVPVPKAKAQATAASTALTKMKKEELVLEFVTLTGIPREEAEAMRKERLIFLLRAIRDNSPAQAKLHMLPKGYRMFSKGELVQLYTHTFETEYLEGTRTLAADTVREELILRLEMWAAEDDDEVDGTYATGVSNLPGTDDSSQEPLGRKPLQRLPDVPELPADPSEHLRGARHSSHAGAPHTGSSCSADSGTDFNSLGCQPPRRNWEESYKQQRRREFRGHRRRGQRDDQPAPDQHEPDRGGSGPDPSRQGAGIAWHPQPGTYEEARDKVLTVQSRRKQLKAGVAAKLFGNLKKVAAVMFFTTAVMSVAVCNAATVTRTRVFGNSRPDLRHSETSLQFAKKGFFALQPIDAKYGSNLSDPAEREELLQTIDRELPRLVMVEFPCTLWPMEPVNHYEIYGSPGPSETRATSSKGASVSRTV